jgi:hypothetical protein
VPVLVEALEDPNQFVVNAAAAALRRVDPVGVLDLLANHRSELAPRKLAAILAGWPMLITLPEAETLLADPDPEVRWTAAQGIWLSEDKGLLPLFERVLSGGDGVVRFWAVSALAGQAQIDVVPLLERLAHDADDFVAGITLSKLARIDEMRAWDLLLDRISSSVSSSEPISQWIAAAEIDIVARRSPAGRAVQGLTERLQSRIVFPGVRESCLVHLWDFADLGPAALRQEQPASEPDPEDSPDGDPG